MRMLFVLITGIVLLGTITTAWYISQPIVLALANGFFGSVTGEGLSILHLVEFANIIWGPAFDGIILFWMVASAQARDIESEVYG
jgi:hypothetical protein